MYYKVLKNDKVIDILDRLVFVKYQPENKIMIVCPKSEAQAIISSDGEYIWHARGLYHIPVGGYDTVDVIPIEKFEYDRLRILNLNTPEEIIDAFVISLLDENII